MAGLSVLPSYQDFLALHPDQSAFSESGSSNTMSQSAWDALTPDQKWQLTQFATLRPGNDGYGQFAQAAETANGAPVGVYQANNAPRVFNQGLLRNVGGYVTTPGRNVPHESMGMPGWFQAGLALMAGGAGAAALGGGAAAAGAGEAGAGAGEGAGAFEGATAGATGSAGAFDGAAASALGSGPGAFEGATAGGTLGSADAAGAAGSAGEAAAGASPFEGATGSGATSNGLWDNLASGNFGNIGSDALTSAMNNPLQAAALLRTGYGLIQNARTPKPGSSSGSKNSGSGTGIASRPGTPAGSYQWTPNPYLLAQIGGRQ